MQGMITFLKTEEGWGFITPEDQSERVHFEIGEFIGPCPGDDEAKRPVEFDHYRDARSRHARRIRLLDSKTTDLPPWANPSALGDALRRWAVLPRPFTRPYTKDRFPSALHRLAAFTLAETWHFGSTPPATRPYPILWNYLCFTFVRHCKQDVLNAHTPDKAFLRVTSDEKWAAFNTGLVNRLYDPVFALFQPNNNRTATGVPWVLFDFCVPGQGRAGKDLANAFNPLPDPPKYFEQSFDMLLDPDQPIHLEADHVIIDGIARERFPYEFLRQNLEARPPQGIEWEDYSRYDSYEREAYLKKLASAVEDDPQAQRSLKNRLEDAKELAVKRVKWNYKTAIPQYYPRADEMSLLLPMCLVNDEVVDIALVVERLESNAYQAATVFPLPWAYQNARLVCRPDSDWLMPERINMDEREEECSEEAESQLEEDEGATREGTGLDRSADTQEDSWAEFARLHENGDVVEGTVQNLANYGAFVDLAEGVTGLLHISKISDDFVQHPADRLSVGQRITVEILRIDTATRKIELSCSGVKADSVPVEKADDLLDDAEQVSTDVAVEKSDEDPWVRYMRVRKIGDIVDGRVSGLKPFGAFVDLAPGVAALVHISEVKEGFVEDISEEIQLGQEIRARIITVDKSAQRIGLSLRGLNAK